MRPPPPTRTFLLCLALPLLVSLLLVSLPCFAQTTTGDDGTQFTNGQNGTPNLPSANSCTIDKTHFAYELNDTAVYSETLRRSNPRSNPPPPPPPVHKSSLYFGSEVRAGSGRPVYILPALTYGLDQYGVEFGAESFYEFGTENDRGRDSVGLSLKVELTELTRGLIRRLAFVKASQSDFRRINFNRTPVVIFDVEGTNGFLDYYVRNTKRPVVSLILGDRFVNDGGSLPQAGISASQLFPFSYGGAGVTLLGVVQAFSARLRGGTHRDADRFGAALIFRDRTPSVVPADDTSGAAVSHLGPTWNVKYGLEYTSPVLGLKETYATFVTYRDTHSYGEITLTAGKDGLRNDYVDVSIGRSFVF